MATAGAKTTRTPPRAPTNDKLSHVTPSLIPRTPPSLQEVTRSCFLPAIVPRCGARTGRIVSAPGSTAVGGLEIGARAAVRDLKPRRDRPPSVALAAELADPGRPMPRTCDPPLRHLVQAHSSGAGYRLVRFGPLLQVPSDGSVRQRPPMRPDCGAVRDIVTIGL